MVEPYNYPTSDTSGASPGSSPYLNRVTWASYKALSRGQLGGLMLGGLLGLGVGLAALGIAGFFLGGIGASIAIPCVLGFTALGAKYYHDVFKQVGASAGAVAAGMEIGEERSKVLNIKLDTILNVMSREGRIAPDEIQRIEDDVEAVYARGQHNFEKKFNQKSPFFWSIGLVGALAGVALVAALGGAGYIASLFTDHPLEIGEFFARHTAAIVTTLTGGALAGATYGINRYYYRPVMNLANALFEGDLSELGKQEAKQRGTEPEQELPEFTPVVSAGKSGGRVYIPPASAATTPSAPATTISSQRELDLRGREELARHLGASWQELQQLRGDAPPSLSIH
jgi:hypothetical protein